MAAPESPPAREPNPLAGASRPARGHYAGQAEGHLQHDFSTSHSTPAMALDDDTMDSAYDISARAFGDGGPTSYNGPGDRYGSLTPNADQLNQARAQDEAAVNGTGALWRKAGPNPPAKSFRGSIA